MAFCSLFWRLSTTFPVAASPHGAAPSTSRDILCCAQAAPDVSSPRPAVAPLKRKHLGCVSKLSTQSTVTKTSRWSPVMATAVCLSLVLRWLRCEGLSWAFGWVSLVFSAHNQPSPHRQHPAPRPPRRPAGSSARRAAQGRAGQGGAPRLLLTLPAAGAEQREGKEGKGRAKQRGAAPQPCAACCGRGAERGRSLSSAAPGRAVRCGAVRGRAGHRAAPPPVSLPPPPPFPSCQVQAKGAGTGREARDGPARSER